MALEDGEPASSRLSHMPQAKPAPLRYSADAYPLPTRMRAAIAALPFETPKLAVTAIGPMSEGFAMQLEKAIARSGKLIEAQAIKTVEAAPEPANDENRGGTKR